MAKALLLVAIACGILRLLRTDVARVLEQWIVALRLNPDNQYIHRAITRLAGVKRWNLQVIGVGTLLYALLNATEGIGLWLRLRWAEYLTVIATASLIPFELFELFRHATLPRFVVLCGNLVILAYLLYRLKADAADGRAAAQLGNPESERR